MAPPGETDRGRRSWLRIWAVPVAGAAGLLLLVYLVAELGPSRIAAQLHGLRSVLPVVLFITAAKYPLQAAGWRLVLPPDTRPSWVESIAATISGDALGYLTWAGPFTGEPLRAYLMRDSVSVVAGTAAGAMERTIYNVTAGLLVWAVLFVLVSATHTFALVAAVAGSVLVVVVLVIRVKHGIRSPALADAPADRHAFAPATKPQGPGRAEAVFNAVRELWRTRRGALPAVTLLCFAQHGVLVAEAYAILNALTDDVTLRTALIFEAVTKIVNTAGLVVPGRLGVSEGGSALLADALGFAASHGLSLALMRRVRALIWAGVGLVLLPLREAQARRHHRLT